MTVKRSRIGRSTSYLQGLVAPPPPGPAARKVPAPGNAAKAMKTSAAAEERRPGVPERSEVAVVGPAGGGFLERCHCCRKKIGEGDDVFMYSYLLAFCSDECREKQIALDKAVEVVLEASKRDTT